MFSRKTMMLAVAAATLCLDAFAAPGGANHDGFVAGAEEAGFSLRQYRYFTTEEEGRGRKALSAPRSPANETLPRDGFVLLAGDIGSQPVQHMYLLQAGSLVHSDECDHAVRMASDPTAGEIEAGRLFSPGA